VELAVREDEEEALADGARRSASGAEEDRRLELLEGVLGRCRSSA
jgi:hypothetical protein